MQHLHSIPGPDPGAEIAVRIGQEPPAPASLPKVKAGDGNGAEQAVVHEAALEDEVDQRVKRVPDEQRTQPGRRRARKHAAGELKGGEEDGDGGGEGGEGCFVEEGGGWCGWVDGHGEWLQRG